MSCDMWLVQFLIQKYFPRHWKVFTRQQQSELQLKPEYFSVCQAQSNVTAGSHEAKSGRSIPGAFHASSDHFFRHCLAVACQSKEAHQINEEGGKVQPPAMLAGGVIRRKDMVIVVEALAAGAESNADVFGWVDAPVVRSVSPEVSDTVDGPRDIKDSHVAKDCTSEERSPAILTPVMDRHDGRQHKTQ